MTTDPIDLRGIPGDLSGWLAAVGLGRLLRRQRGVRMGYVLSEHGCRTPWQLVVEAGLDDVARAVEASLSRPALEARPAPRLYSQAAAAQWGPATAGDRPHFLKFYAGRQTVETTLRRARQICLDGRVSVAERLVDPCVADPRCPTFYWSGCHGPDQPPVGRPLVEHLAWIGLCALHRDPIRWSSRDHYHHRGLSRLEVIVPLFPVDFVPTWLRTTLSRSRRWLRHVSPRPGTSDRPPGRVVRPELWGCAVIPTDKYRRQAGPVSPVFVHGRSLVR